MQTNQIVMRPMEWAPLPDIEDVEPLNDMDADCLSEIQAVLKRHGKQDRFGVTLIHKHFDMAEDEVLLEHTHLEDRRLVLAPVKTDAADVVRSVQTAWMFSDNGGELMRACYRRCFRNIQGNHSDGGHYWA
ncbi:MAG: hypothetical protein QM647_08880 [Asticcacaulis sp.]|uniref:hypothetical protein n=1 Tax=Asticcacaulis sp. TaxID=1872648 RepID=UPI0039E5A061